MNDYVALEIGLARLGEDRWRAELRYSRPDANTDREPAAAEIRLAPSELDVHYPEDAAYGQALGRALLGASCLRAEFAAAFGAAQSLNRKLRIRLFLHQDALDLHRLRWETLRHPESGDPLLYHERVLFSRMVAGGGLDDVRLRPKAELRALAVVANPRPLADKSKPWSVEDETSAGLARRRLAPIAVAEEIERARHGLADIPIDVLASDPDAPVRVTLAAIDAKLRERPYDILYLVCHGALHRDAATGTRVSRLYLEREDGHMDVADGADLVERLRSLEDRPRLVVLASCQSAGSGNELALADHGALAALGPQIAAAGVPAVLGMQGNVLMATVALLMPTFFAELSRHGEVDRALAAARAVARDQPDSWMPVLYSRLRHGCIWYVPGFTGTDDFDRWPNLLGSIAEGRCTPILGFGLTASLFGTQREIASHWARSAGFPLAPERARELPYVAQYLAVDQSPGVLRRKLATYLRQRLSESHESELRETGLDAETARLSALVSALGALRRRHDPNEPHAVLARLGLSLYVTANPDNQLADALAELGRKPVVEFCRWKGELQDPDRYPSIYDIEREYLPTPERPLVYHLFGVLDHPESVVLAEDDYFDYLMGMKRRNAVPSQVTAAWTRNALLFLGMRMDDWGFRVLFRSVLDEERRHRLRDFHSVAVQLGPNDESYRDPERVTRYLERYCGFGGAQIDTYWGDVSDFICELARRWPPPKGG